MFWERVALLLCPLILLGYTPLDSLRNFQPYGWCSIVDGSAYTILSRTLVVYGSGKRYTIFFQGPSLMTGDAHVWSHCRQTCGPLILYIWDHTTTRPRGGVVVWTVRPYLDIWHIYSCIYTHIYIITNGFMVADAGPLLLVKEELCITLMYMKD